MSDMVDVLRRELAKGSYQMPGDTLPYETQAARIAAALSAAGFGPVQEARAAALEAAAEAIDEDPYDDLDPFYAGWLRDRAQNIREAE